MPGQIYSNVSIRIVSISRNISENQTAIKSPDLSNAIKDYIRQYPGHRVGAQKRRGKRMNEPKMSRADRRRLEKQQKKESSKQANQANQEIDLQLPKVKLSAAHMPVSSMPLEKIQNATGVRLAILKEWQEGREKEIRALLIREMQEKLDKFESYITLCNIVATMSALRGFRYGKAAATYLYDHYSGGVDLATRESVRESYEWLHDNWGIEMEFDDPDLNKELGLDIVDWRDVYTKEHIPLAVYDKIYNDAQNIERLHMQPAVIWALCEGFGFHKYLDSPSNKLKKFMALAQEKYDLLLEMDRGGTYGKEILMEKYGVDIGWSDKLQETAERFNM